MGSEAEYFTRSQAIRKLQVSLNDFRRLCILKGVFPREPKKKFKGSDKTYYHKKDIQYLFHDQLLEKFNSIKAHMKKYRKAIHRGEKSNAKRILKNKPVYSLHYILKERYPTFPDALRDLDDALTLLCLFATFPAHETLKIRNFLFIDEISSTCGYKLPAISFGVLFVRDFNTINDQGFSLDKGNLLSSQYSWSTHHLDSALQVHSKGIVNLKRNMCLTTYK